MVSTAAMASGVNTRCAWPGRGESVTELMPFMNFLVHSHTCCSDRHASPYWTFIRWWILMGFHPLTKLFYFGACCKRGGHLNTGSAPSCCVPASYCHLSATLQNHEYHCCQLTRKWSCVSNFYHTFKVFIWHSLVHNILWVAGTPPIFKRLHGMLFD
jgi:hypothetical protein